MPAPRCPLCRQSVHEVLRISNIAGIDDGVSFIAATSWTIGVAADTAVGAGSSDAVRELFENLGGVGSSGGVVGTSAATGEGEALQEMEEADLEEGRGSEADFRIDR